MTTRTIITTVPALDALACMLAWLLSKVSRISGAGVFWISGGSSFWEAWKEPSQGGGSWTLRMGRLELVADYEAREGAVMAR